jgi:hypothetical protein
VLYFNNWFGFGINYTRIERTFNLSLRIFGIDFDFALYGYLTDWSFPFMFVPSKRGWFFKTLFFALFVGRLSQQSKIDLVGAGSRDD